MIDAQHRLNELKTKAQRAGLTKEERLEVVALNDQLQTPPNLVEKPLINKAHAVARKTGREAAELLIGSIDLAIQALSGQEDSARATDSFWRTIRERFRQELLSPQEQLVHPFSEAEAQGWGDTMRVTFGKYNGSLISDIPLQYLLWLELKLNSEEQDFKRDLKRYLASGLRKENEEP